MCLEPFQEVTDQPLLHSHWVDTRLVVDIDPVIWGLAILAKTEAKRVLRTSALSALLRVSFPALVSN